MTGTNEPRDDQSGGQSPPGLGAVWEAIGPRNAALIVGGIVVLVLLLSLLGGGDVDDDVALDTTTVAPDGQQDSDPLGLFGRSDDRPAVDPIRGCDLLTDEVLLAALGSEQRGLDQMGNSKRGQGEACTARLAIDNAYRVSIEPGEPSDFAPGATLDGHQGVPVDDVGDSTVWFPGPDDDGHTAQLAVHRVTPIGDLVFRVAIGRPDLAPEAQLPYVSAAARELLPLFPHVQSEPPEPEELVFETDPPPPTAQTLGDLVVAGAADGRWSLGEGLAEGLRYLLGEPSGFQPPSELDPFESSGSGLIEMAIAYSENGDDGSARAEIETLLDGISPLEWIPPPTGDTGTDGEATAPRPSSSLTAVSTSDAEITPVAFSVTARRVPVAQVTDDGSADCLYEDRSVYGPDEPTCKPPCFWLYRAVPTDPYCLEEIGGMELYYPEAIIEPILEGSAHGWDRDDLDAIRQGVVASAGYYGQNGRVDNIKVMVSNQTAALGHVFPHVLGPDECWVYLTTPLQDFAAELQAFSVAIDVAGCLAHNQLPETVFDEAGAFLWWYRGVTTYLASEALPESNVEWQLIDDLEESELRTSLQDNPNRSSNWGFFSSVALEAGGPFGAFDIVGPLSDAPSIQAQQDKLATVSGIETSLQDFHEQLSDGFVGDGFYDPPARPIALRPYMRLRQEITRFGASRYHVTVPSGRYACFENRSGNVKVSWRSGAPGSATTGFEDGVPVDLTDEAVIVVTSVHEGQSFDALVKLFRDPGCGDDEDDSDDVDMPEPCRFCDPSLFYRNPGSVDDAKSGSSDGDEQPDSGGGDAGDGGGTGGGGGGDTGDGGGAPPSSQDPDEVDRWLESLCPIWDEWMDRIEITDGVDPATLDFDDRIDRATRITEAFVDASDDLLQGLDDVDAPEVYRPYQQTIADEVESVRDDMQDYLDDGFETITDLSDAGLERQVGMSLINSEPRKALDDMSEGDRRLFETVADGIPACLFLPR